MKTVDEIGKKLSKAREVCPNLEEGVYELVDCIGKIACQCNLPAVGLANLTHILVTDIHNGKTVSLCTSLSKELIAYRGEILTLVKSVPYVVIATVDDEEFVNRFCRKFNQLFYLDN